MRLSDNPIYARLTRDAGWPSMRLCVWISLGLAAVTLALCLNDFSRFVQSASVPWISAILGVAGWLAGLLMPPACAIAAAVVARGRMAEDEFDVLRLTDVTPTQFVSGLIGGILFRLRGLLIVQAGLLPAIILGCSNALIFGLYVVKQIGANYGMSQYQPAPLDMVVVAAQVSLMALGLGIFSLCCAAFGVALNLGSPSPIPAVLGVLGATAGSVVWGIALLTLISVVTSPPGCQAKYRHNAWRRSRWPPVSLSLCC